MIEIRNLLFDFGNVIMDLDLDGSKLKIKALLDHKYSSQTVEKFLLEKIEQFEVGAISREIFLNAMLKYARRDTQALDVIEAWNSMLLGIPSYRLTMLEQLRENYGVYLLSNTNEIHLEWAHLHLKKAHEEEAFNTRYFDDVYYSHIIQSRKPDPDSFRHVIENGMITPEYTLFIDDFEPNIEAAKTLGFQTLLNPADEEIAEVLKVQGYY